MSSGMRKMGLRKRGKKFQFLDGKLQDEKGKFYEMTEWKFEWCLDVGTMYSLSMKD